MVLTTYEGVLWLRTCVQMMYMYRMFFKLYITLFLCILDYSILFSLQDKGEAIPSFNVQAKESSKEEEVAAICKLRGVEPGAAVASQLRALDEEYHHLLDSNQGGKAEHVMGLYAWYSKKISQVSGRVVFRCS